MDSGATEFEIEYINVSPDESVSHYFRVDYKNDDSYASKVKISDTIVATSNWDTGEYYSK